MKIDIYEAAIHALSTIAENDNDITTEQYEEVLEKLREVKAIIKR